MKSSNRFFSLEVVRRLMYSPRMEIMGSSRGQLSLSDVLEDPNLDLS